jgi:non-ribosomal peptide synthetase component F
VDRIAGLPVQRYAITTSPNARHPTPRHREQRVGRIYRTGDLGRINEQADQYLGRIDTQVKIGGTELS